MWQLIRNLLIGGWSLVVLLGAAGCAAENEANSRQDQTPGYVEPENRQMDREYREAFRPDVPKMY